MNGNDFSEFYKISGPIMQENLEKLIINESENAIIRGDVDNACVDYLLSLNEEEYLYIYYGLSNVNNYTAFINLNNIEQEYTYIDCIHAYVSNIELLKKCLSITNIILNNALKRMFNCNDIMINLNIESCMLLCDNGIDVKHITNITSNMNSVKYLIDRMSAIDLYDILSDITYLLNRNCRSVGLVKIYIIDRIYEINNSYLKSVLNQNMLHNKTIPFFDFDNNRDQFECFHLKTCIATCYYIIKYMSTEEGKKHNEYFIWKNINHSRNTSELTKSVDALEMKYKSMLEFHFRPRGAHTKGAVNSS
jgi:hypothetical protein